MEKIQGIKTSDGFFLKNAKGYLFAGEEPQPTWKPEWFKVRSIENIVKVVPEVKHLKGYSLKSEYAPSEALPKWVEEDFFGEGKWEDPRYSFYEPQYDVTPATTEPTDKEVEIVAEVDGELVEKSIAFPVYGKWPNSDGKNWTIRNQQLKLGLLDEIITPDILKQERPCELSSADSYKIIRTHIKDNINPRVAELSSDYDFCLTVTKKLPLAEKEAYQFDENWRLFGSRKRKPKFVTKYRTDRKLNVYEIAPRLENGVYKGYTEAPQFRGENVESLQANINEYLENLMEEINRPLRDCPTCKGHGVIEYDLQKN